MKVKELTTGSPEHRFFKSFVAAVGAQEQARTTWNTSWSNSGWTSIATAALVKVASAQHREVAAIGHADRWKQSEYLSLDVVGYDGEWGPPSTIVEHENTAWKVPYCAWKLAAVDADLRVLVAYFNPKGRGAKPGSNSRPKSFDEMAQQLVAPLDKNPGRPVLLIGGSYWKRASEKKGFSKVFSACICVGER